MKKVLSFVLVLSMILGSFGMAFAAPAADVVGKDCEDAVNVLTELGVVAGYKDGSFKPENIVTRAEMATFIIKAMGLADYAVEKSAFTDMAGHWADPFVAYAASLGFVKGNTDGTFAPDATVTYDQAITMLVQALGYKGEYLVGGYPGAFVNQAKALGMLDGVKSGVAGANRGDVAVLLYNTLDCGFVRYTNDGATEGAGGSMMTRLADVRSTFEDVVNETHTGAVDMKDYLGAYVEAYLDKDGEFITVKDVKSTFLTGKVNAAGKFVADEVEYTFAEGFPTTPGAVTTQASIYFVNGDSNNATNTTAMGIGNGTVTIAAKVSGKTIKSVYSIAKWTVNAGDQKVDEVDLDQITAAAPGLLSGVFKLTDNKEIDTDYFALKGVDALEDIKADNVVYVYEDSDYITKIEVGTEVVTGEVAKINAAAGKVTVNGKAYEFSTESGADAYTDVKVGGEYEFYLDYAGDIYEAKALTEEAENYGIVIDVADGSDSLRASDALAKLVMADAEAKTFVLDEEALEDGDIISTSVSITTVAISTPSVVKYNVNEAGKIDKMESVSLETVTAGTITKKGTFAGRTISSDVVILTMENLTTSSGVLTTDAKKYDVVTLADVLGQEDVIARYELNTKGEIVFMVINATGTSKDVVYGFVTAVDEVADSEGEVTMLVAGKEEVYKAKSKDTYSKAHTLVAVTFDADGYAVAPKSGDDKSATVAALTSGAITKVTDKVYVGEDFAITLDTAVVVYEVNDDNDLVVASKSDLRGELLSNIDFWDIDEDAVADIVVIK